MWNHISFLLKESSSRSLNCEGQLTTWEQHDPRPVALTQAGRLDATPWRGPRAPREMGDPGPRLETPRRRNPVSWRRARPAARDGCAPQVDSGAEEPSDSDASRVIGLDESGQPCLPWAPGQLEGLGPCLKTTSACDHCRCMWLRSRSGHWTEGPPGRQLKPRHPWRVPPESRGTAVQSSGPGSAPACAPRGLGPWGKEGRALGAVCGQLRLRRLQEGHCCP